MRLCETINEGNGGPDRTARHSSALRGAEVIFTVSFLPVYRVPFLLRTGSCRAIVTLSSLPHQRSPLGNRQSDQPEPLQSTDPDHKYLARDRFFDYQSCIYSNVPNPSRTLLQDCHVVIIRKTLTDRTYLPNILSRRHICSPGMDEHVIFLQKEL